MAKKSRDTSMHGEDIATTFGDTSVVLLEGRHRQLATELAELEDRLDKETDTEEIEKVLEQISEKRDEVSQAHHEVVKARREFTDIARGNRR